jgi:hypothetical protein
MKASKQEKNKKKKQEKGCYKKRMIGQGSRMRVKIKNLLLIFVVAFIGLVSSVFSALQKSSNRGDLVPF